MNQISSAALALILAIVLWVLGKKPSKWPNSLTSTNDHLSGNEPNRNAYGLIEKRLLQKGIANLTEWEVEESNQKNNSPKTPQEKIKLIKTIKHLSRKDPDQRLKAVLLAGEWGDRSVLPIIRRGLQDSDRRVQIAAASAIYQYKGGLIPQESEEKLRPPRNVALMR